MWKIASVKALINNLLDDHLLDLYFAFQSDSYEWVQEILREIKAYRLRRRAPMRRPTFPLAVEQLEPRVVPTMTGGPITMPTLTEGNPLEYAPIFTFSDSDPSFVAGQFSVTVTWGDGTVDSGTPYYNGGIQIVPQGSTGFQVLGQHIYQDEATGLNFSIQVTDPNGESVSASTTVDVADATLFGGSYCGPTNASVGQAFTNIPLMFFGDNDGDAPTSDFTATIDWGDGTSSTGWMVLNPGNGGLLDYFVYGSHTYEESGDLTISVQAVDDGGQTVSASTDVLVQGAQTAPQITWSNPADITYGTPLDGTQLDASAKNECLPSRNACRFGGLIV